MVFSYDFVILVWCCLRNNVVLGVEGVEDQLSTYWLLGCFLIALLIYQSWGWTWWAFSRFLPRFHFSSQFLLSTLIWREHGCSASSNCYFGIIHSWIQEAIYLKACFYPSFTLLLLCWPNLGSCFIIKRLHHLNQLFLLRLRRNCWILILRVFICIIPNSILVQLFRIKWIILSLAYNDLWSIV